MPTVIAKFKIPVLAVIRFLQKNEQVNKNIGIVIIEQIDERFENQGDPDRKWKPLSPITIKKRRQDGKGARILQDTRDLQGSFHYKINKVTVGSKTFISEVGIYGSPHPQAKMIHQKGFRGVIPVKGYSYAMRAQLQMRKVGKEKKLKMVYIPAGIRVVKPHSMKQDIPARPMVRFTQQNLQDIVDTIDFSLKKEYKHG